MSTQKNYVVVVEYENERNGVIATSLLEPGMRIVAMHYVDTPNGRQCTQGNAVIKTIEHNRSYSCVEMILDGFEESPISVYYDSFVALAKSYLNDLKKES